jgi:hypothetical protein
MDDDLGVACLRSAGLQDTGCVIRIVASDSADVVHVRNIRDYCEPGHGPGMAIAPGLGELTCRYTLAPIGWLEVMEIAL